jgi:hypothetical protein
MTVRTRVANTLSHCSVAIGRTESFRSLSAAMTTRRLGRLAVFLQPLRIDQLDQRAPGRSAIVR